MTHKRKGQLASIAERAKHLRKFGKRFFWKRERFEEKRTIKNDIKEKNQNDSIINK